MKNFFKPLPHELNSVLNELELIEQQEREANKKASLFSLLCDYLNKKMFHVEQ
jgi:hypothetical protein